MRRKKVIMKKKTGKKGTRTKAKMMKMMRRKWGTGEVAHSL